MKFVSKEQITHRAVGKHLELDLYLILVDVQPNDIETMQKVLSDLEKILSNKFELVASPDPEPSKRP